MELECELPLHSTESRVAELPTKSKFRGLGKQLVVYGTVSEATILALQQDSVMSSAHETDPHLILLHVGFRQAGRPKTSIFDSDAWEMFGMRPPVR